MSGGGTKSFVWTRGARRAGVPPDLIGTHLTGWVAALNTADAMLSTRYAKHVAVLRSRGNVTHVTIKRAGGHNTGRK